MLISLFVSEPAYSRGGGGGGCFAKGTLISTPKGNKQIEQLLKRDRLINYNFSTHPFYIKTSGGIELTQVRDLHSGDRLIKQDNSLVAVDSIEHIYKSITVYNLVSINPNHNFYADGFLVHNKGGGGGGGGYGGGASGGQPVQLLKKISQVFFKHWHF